MEESVRFYQSFILARNILNDNIKEMLKVYVLFCLNEFYPITFLIPDMPVQT